jgi:DNA-binding transcriptional MerR regulator
MVEVEYLSISEFAELAGVSKQAIYKQVNNENSQIAPYLLRDGKRTLIKVSALSELYKVDITNLTFTTPAEDAGGAGSTPTGQPKVEETTPPTTADNPIDQPNNPNSTPDFQPISTDYIEYLKAQVADLKAEKEAVEMRLSATIAEKDSIIKDQSAQLARLAQQVAQIADKALITTAQQQYLTARAGGEAVDLSPAEDPPVVEQAEEKPKKGFWGRLFGKK